MVIFHGKGFYLALEKMQLWKEEMVGILGG